MMKGLKNIFKWRKGRDEQELVQQQVSSESTSLELFLSDDLIAEILIRLPPKTLFSSKCVCKNWHGLISDQTFITRFIRRSKSVPLPPLITGYYYEKRICNGSKTEVCFYEASSSTTDDDRQLIGVDTSLSFLKLPSINVVDSHSGFVLCAEKLDFGDVLVPYYFRYIICNPLTKEWMYLPEPARSHSIRQIVLYCYEDETEFSFRRIKFKVFCFITWEVNELVVDIYCSELGQWKKSTMAHGLNGSCPLNRKTLSNGSVYFWNQSHLCRCDLETEDIHIMELPSISGYWRSGRIGVSSGSLCFFETTRTQFRIWILGDKVGWSLKHFIDGEILRKEFPGILKCGDLFRALAFHPQNDEFPVGIIGGVRVFIYRMNSRRVELVNESISTLYSPFIPYSLPAWLPCVKIT